VPFRPPIHQPYRRQSKPSARARGYTTAWEGEAKRYLAAHPTCARCPAPSQVVDHVRPHRGNRELFWDRSNWQPLCRSCHNHKTATEDAAGFGR